MVHVPGAGATEPPATAVRSHPLGTACQDASVKAQAGSVVSDDSDRAQSVVNGGVGHRTEARCQGRAVAPPADDQEGGS